MTILSLDIVFCSRFKSTAQNAWSLSPTLPDYSHQIKGEEYCFFLPFSLPLENKFTLLEDFQAEMSITEKNTQLTILDG